MKKRVPFVGRVQTFRGLLYASSVLGCDVSHLRRMLQGKRQSKRLRERVREKFPQLLEEVAS